MNIEECKKDEYTEQLKRAVRYHRLSWATLFLALLGWMGGFYVVYAYGSSAAACACWIASTLVTWQANKWTRMSAALYTGEVTNSEQDDIS